MKTFKKIVLVLVIIIGLSLIGGHYYFEKKFTPPENSLTVSNLAHQVPVRWNTADENPYSALYLPVYLKGIDKPLYMQLDFGSPVTLFYAKSIASVQVGFPDQIKPDVENKKISLHFRIGSMNVSSENFSLMQYGEKIDLDNPAVINVIGTIGTDLLEKRIAILDFKNNACSFIDNMPENGWEDFEFKKRRIIIPATIENEKLKLLYDSGSSNYELITSKEEWEKYKVSGARVKVEKGNSWGNQLKVISAPAKRSLKIGNTSFMLSEVTYVEGTSAIQNFLMKSSGMQGMIGNKLFLSRKLILDCKNEKFKIE